MSGVDILVAVILLAILSGAAFYIVRAKKSGNKCIGCPNSGSCGAKGGCSCKH